MSVYLTRSANFPCDLHKTTLQPWGFGMARLLPGRRSPTYEVLRGLADGTKAVYTLGGSMSWRVARVDAT